MSDQNFVNEWRSVLDRPLDDFVPRVRSTMETTIIGDRLKLDAQFKNSKMQSDGARAFAAAATTC
jgi:hypothetical protein